MSGKVDGNGNITETPCVSREKIVNGAINFGKLDVNAVQTTTIKDGAVTNSKLANNAIQAHNLEPDIINSTHIIDRQILHNALSRTSDANGAAVYTDNIKDANVTRVKLLDACINNSKIDDNAVNTRCILNSSITSDKIGIDQVKKEHIKEGEIYGSADPQVTSHIKEGTITATEIFGETITTNKIATGAITDVKIAYKTIEGTTRIIDNSISHNQIAKQGTNRIITQNITPGAIDETLIKAGCITSSLITDGTIVSNDLANNSVITSKILNQNITTEKIADNSITTVKILPGNVTTSSISTDGANRIQRINLDDDIIDETKIADDSIKREHILNGEVINQHIQTQSIDSRCILNGGILTDDIAMNAITTGKIKDLAVIDDKLATNSVIESKIATNAVTSSKIKDGNITNAKLSHLCIAENNIIDSAVTENKIAFNTILGGSLPNTHIKPGTITYANIANNTIVDNNISLATINGDKIQNAPNGITFEKINNEAIRTAHIKDLQITNAKMSANAIDTIQLVNKAVTNNKIADNTITNDKIANATIANDSLANLCVDTNNIVNDAITNDKIADDSIVTSNIQNNQITAAKLGPDSVISSKIADSAILTAHIDDAQITEAKLGSGSVTNQKIGSKAVKTSNIDDNAITNTQINNNTIEIDKLSTVLKNKLDGGVNIICGKDLTQITTNQTNISNHEIAINNLTNNAPEALNTLKELADALGSDANFSTTILTNINSRVKADENTSIDGIFTFNTAPVLNNVDLLGNSTSASKFKNTVKIAGIDFDGSADIAINATDLADVTSTGSGSIITTAERDLLTQALGGSIIHTNDASKYVTNGNLETDPTQQITGKKNFAHNVTFTDGIIIPAGKTLNGEASTVTNGIYTTSSVTDLSDVTNVGSGKIITDNERTKLQALDDTLIATKAETVHITGNQNINGNKTFLGTVTANNNIVGNITGSAGSASQLDGAKMIGGVVFDNTQHITPRKIDIQTDQSTDINQLVCFAPTTGSSDINTDNRLTWNPNDGTLTATKFVGNVESVGIISGSSTKLATSRKFGTNFDAGVENKRASQTFTIDANPTNYTYSIKINGTTISFQGVANDANATATALESAFNITGFLSSVSDNIVTIQGLIDSSSFTYQSGDAATTSKINEITNENVVTVNNGVSNGDYVYFNGTDHVLFTPKMIGIDSWQNTLPNLTAIGTTNVDTVFSGPIDAQEGLKGDVTGDVT